MGAQFRKGRFLNTASPQPVYGHPPSADGASPALPPRALNIAQKVSGMDGDKAYIVGMLHDIGRRVGIVNIPKHVYEGYKYAMDRGWDEASLLCSFP